MGELTELAAVVEDRLLNLQGSVVELERRVNIHRSQLRNGEALLASHGAEIAELAARVSSLEGGVVPGPGPTPEPPPEPPPDPAVGTLVGVGMQCYQSGCVPEESQFRDEDAQAREYLHLVDLPRVYDVRDTKAGRMRALCEKIGRPWRGFAWINAHSAEREKEHGVLTEGLPLWRDADGNRIAYNDYEGEGGIHDMTAPGAVAEKARAFGVWLDLFCVPNGITHIHVDNASNSVAGIFTSITAGGSVVKRGATPNGFQGQAWWTGIMVDLIVAYFEECKMRGITMQFNIGRLRGDSQSGPRWNVPFPLDTQRVDYANAIAARAPGVQVFIEAAGWDLHEDRVQAWPSALYHVLAADLLAADCVFGASIPESAWGKMDGHLYKAALAACVAGPTSTHDIYPDFGSRGEKVTAYVDSLAQRRKELDAVQALGKRMAPKGKIVEAIQVALTENTRFVEDHLWFDPASKVLGVGFEQKVLVIDLAAGNVLSGLAVS